MSQSVLRNIALALALLLPSLGLAQEKAKPVEQKEQIKFEQDKAQAHMKELEERMFELAKLIRDSQPDDSARLLMGVQKAREHLIAEQMGEAATLLTSLKLDQATEEQKQVIEKLEELKKLLLTADIGLEVKLEQLRKLLEAREELAKLTEAEQSQLKSTEEGLKKEAPPGDFKTLEPSEKRNQRQADDLEQLVKEFGGLTKGAAGAIGAASQSMGKAGESLGKGEGKPAAPSQDEAVKKLKEADKDLAAAEEELKKELEGLVRRQVMEHLANMIAMQKQVRETTEKLQPRIAEGSAPAVASLKRLSDSEEQIITLAHDCIDLCELTEFSVAFPTALGDVAAKMEVVRDQLGDGLGNDEVVLQELEIESDLEGLLSALKQASKPNPEGESGECQGCKGNMNKLLAELKMVRQMEVSLQSQTQRIDDLVVAKKITPDQRTQRCEPLQARQEQVLEATTKIADTYGAKE
jgi:cytochrome c556